MVRYADLRKDNCRKPSRLCQLEIMGTRKGALVARNNSTGFVAAAADDEDDELP